MGEAGKKGSVQLSICQGADACGRSIYLKDIAGFREGSAFPGVLDIHLKSGESVIWKTSCSHQLVVRVYTTGMEGVWQIDCCRWRLSGEGGCPDAIRGRRWAALYTLQPAASRYALLPRMLPSKLFFTLIGRPLSTQPQPDDDNEVQKCTFLWHPVMDDKSYASTEAGWALFLVSSLYKCFFFGKQTAFLIQISQHFRGRGFSVIYSCICPVFVLRRCMHFELGESWKFPY